MKIRRSRNDGGEEVKEGDKIMTWAIVSLLPISAIVPLAEITNRDF